MRTFVLSGFLILLSCVRASGQQTCSQEVLRSAADRARSTEENLLRVKVISSQDLGLDIAPATQKLIGDLKDAVAETIAGYLRCETSADQNAEKIREDLSRMLGANGSEPSETTSTKPVREPDDHIFGSQPTLSVERLADGPELLALKYQFGIICGVDNMLLVFEKSNGQWSQVLRWQSEAYSKISEAFGDLFTYVLVRRNDANKWVLALAHGMPWCTSRWSVFDLDVIQPAREQEPQRVLFHKEAGYIRLDDVIMKPRANGFELGLTTGSIDSGLMTRVVIYSYRFVGDTLQRVQPMALNGRDFVDEWLQSDWHEAALWSAKQNLEKLSEVHAGIARLRDPKRTTWPILSYGAVRPCPGNSQHFQVELDADPGTTTYFQILQGKNSFEMLSAATAPDPTCHGPDLMRKP